MRNFVMLMGLLLLTSLGVAAQDNSDNPKVDVFGGYSYLRYAPASGAARANFNGGVGSISYRIGEWISVVGEVARYHNGSVNGSIVSASVVTYLGGPKASATLGKFTPFAQVLFGGAHASVSDIGASASQNAFATAFGAGLDWNVKRGIDVRFLQIEDLVTTFNSGAFGGSSSGNQNGLRCSSGIVFRF